jgi:hypothetical protein
MNHDDDVAIGEAQADRSDRRTMIRHRRQLAVSVETLQAGAAPWPGWTDNVSAEGLNVLLGRRFGPGTPLSISFDEGTATPLTVLARVQWVEPNRGGWLHGCQFAKPVDDEEFRLLLQEVQQAPAPPPVTSPSDAETIPIHASTEPTPQRVDLRAIRDKLRRLGEGTDPSSRDR